MKKISLFLGFLVVASAEAQPAPRVWEKVLAPGLIYRMEVDSAAPRVVHALRMSPKAPGLRARPEVGTTVVYQADATKGRRTVSQMVAQNQAIAGVNADFFPFTGDPLGLMVRNGEFVSAPSRTRGVFAWGPEGAGMGLTTMQGSVTAEGVSAITLDGLNEECGENAVVLNSATAGLAIGKAPVLAVVLKLSDPNEMLRPTGTWTATVLYALPDAASTKVNSGNLILVASGTKVPAVAALRPGSQVSIKLATTGLDWSKYDNAVGGGPFLVCEGKVAVDAESQGFRPGFSTDRHPRTAVGRTADGDLWWVVIDGRQKLSVGATLAETAAIMIRLGCVEAVNLDGGGSSTMNVGGLPINRPSDKTGERPVANGVLFFAKPVADGAKLRFSLVRPIALGSEVKMRVLGPDGKPIPDSEIWWTMQGSAWIDQSGVIRGLEAGDAELKAYVRGRVLSATVKVTPAKPVRA